MLQKLLLRRKTKERVLPSANTFAKIIFRWNDSIYRIGPNDERQQKLLAQIIN
jgi:hypothetical protein